VKSLLNLLDEAEGAVERNDINLAKKVLAKCRKSVSSVPTSSHRVVRRGRPSCSYQPDSLPQPLLGP
jgi:hypothetical protein